MLKSLIASEKRVFAIGFIVVILGIYFGMNLPVSLYPQTSKPVVRMRVNYAGLSSQEFTRKYGANIEFQLSHIQKSGLKVLTIESDYENQGVTYTITYDWNTPYNQALKEVQNISSSLKALLPKESADSIGVWQWRDNGGFLAISFFSPDRTTQQLYESLDPILTAELAKIIDAEDAVLWNPSSEEISLKINPEKLASYGLMPRDIYVAVEKNLPNFSGASLRSGHTDLNFQISSPLKTIRDLDFISISLSNRKEIFLKDVASVRLQKSESNKRFFKTDGMDSLILFASPKSGANVKRMAEDILDLLNKKSTQIPKDISYKKLVDPSEFIRNSINNLINDIFLASSLAVLVLFLFIGNLKNVLTVAFEIPMSMLAAFIVMYYTGLNLNLISLGGLALAAGMNVDASIVVLENIFKHQEWWVKNNRGIMSVSDRLDVIYRAVKEVIAPIILSTLTSLIVFIPLVMTSDLTQAILGDLARAVVYSHSASCLVALLIVPSIRFFIFKRSQVHLNKAPLEGMLIVTELLHQKLISKLWRIKGLGYLVWTLPLAICFLLAITILPKLPKEIIGTPDTDWIYLNIYASQSESSRQLENLIQETELKAKEIMQDNLLYTFVQGHNEKSGNIMLRLRDKKKMQKIIDDLLTKFKNTPDTYYNIGPWNPAELPLPNDTHLKVAVVGKDWAQMREVSSELRYHFKNWGDYDRLEIKPDIIPRSALVFEPYPEIWNYLQMKGERFSMSDVIDLTVYAQLGKTPGGVNLDGKLHPIQISFEDHRFSDPKNLMSYPVMIENKVIPLSALGAFKFEALQDHVYRIDGKDQITIIANLDPLKKNEWERMAKVYHKKIKEISEPWLKDKNVQIELLPSQEELTKALTQIGYSVLISFLLIIFVLWFKFQNMKEVAVIMMTIPFGIVGVLFSLWFFNSNLSLNSALGIILLNGISVNNSILLLEYVKSNQFRKIPLNELILEASARRLRPILITSLTTILGMMPIALGLGDGGKILQPLGIAVVFGMMFSTVLTLTIIPTLLMTIYPDNYKEKPDDQLSPVVMRSDNDVEIKQWQ